MTSDQDNKPDQKDQTGQHENRRSESGVFLFVACNPQVQQLCKAEIQRSCPMLLPSFSRPGFLTYKVDTNLPARFILPLTFARTYGWSSGQLRGDSLEDIARQANDFRQKHDAAGIHIWNRDWDGNSKPHQNLSPGQDQNRPNRQTMAAESQVQKMAQILMPADGHPSDLSPTSRATKGLACKVNAVAEPDKRVVDLIRIDDQHWWLGYHLAGSLAQRWPGGIPPIKPPDSMLSRAYMKTAEALMWSGISIQPGDVCVEIGAAPGGSCQRLLELDARVLAVDPAELDPIVLKDKNLKHLRMRGREVPHRELADASWLLVDSNVVPDETLDTVQSLVTSNHTRFRGLLLTLKLGKSGWADRLPEFVEQVRSWGFQFVKTRHLAFSGRREILLMALKQKSVRRFRSRR